MNFHCENNSSKNLKRFSWNSLSFKIHPLIGMVNILPIFSMRVIWTMTKNSWFSDKQPNIKSFTMQITWSIRTHCCCSLLALNKAQLQVFAGRFASFSDARFEFSFSLFLSPIPEENQYIVFECVRSQIEEVLRGNISSQFKL